MPHKEKGPARERRALSKLPPAGNSNMIAGFSARTRAYFDRRDWYGERRFYLVGEENEVFLFTRFRHRLRDPEWAKMIESLRAEGINVPFVAFVDGKPRGGKPINLLGSLAY